MIGTSRGSDRDMPDKDAADSADVHIELSHQLRDRHALKRCDQLRQTWIISISDDVDGTPVVETGDRLDEPYWNVGRIHHLCEPVDQCCQLQDTGRVPARRSTDAVDPPAGATHIGAGRVGYMCRSQVAQVTDASNLVGQGHLCHARHNRDSTSNPREKCTMNASSADLAGANLPRTARPVRMVSTLRSGLSHTRGHRRRIRTSDLGVRQCSTTGCVQRPPRWSSRAARNCSGWSRCGPCPASATTTSR